MKVLFLSDIHGSLSSLEAVNELYLFESFDKIVLLGDLLYHGPRNPIPLGYDCMGVANYLNKFKDKIIAVRGNCDSEVDQMVLEFDVTKDYVEMELNGKSFFITHGHLFDKDNLPNIDKEIVFIHGHYHVPIIENINNFTILNPSSITLPKKGLKSFGILDGDEFKIININNEIVNKIKL